MMSGAGPRPAAVSQAAWEKVGSKGLRHKGNGNNFEKTGVQTVLSTGMAQSDANF